MITPRRRTAFVKGEEKYAHKSAKFLLGVISNLEQQIADLKQQAFYREGIINLLRKRIKISTSLKLKAIEESRKTRRKLKNLEAKLEDKVAVEVWRERKELSEMREKLQKEQENVSRASAKYRASASVVRELEKGTTIPEVRAVDTVARVFRVCEELGIELPKLYFLFRLSVADYVLNEDTGLSKSTVDHLRNQGLAATKKLTQANNKLYWYITPAGMEIVKKARNLLSHGKSPLLQ